MASRDQVLSFVSRTSHGRWLLTDVDKADDKRVMAVYRRCLQVRPHVFDRYFGDLYCVCVTNSPPEDVQLVVAFFHGFGASPGDFANIFDPIRVMGRAFPMVLILPCAPTKMHPEEYGAVELDELPECRIGPPGSYKWWDVLDPGWSCTRPVCEAPPFDRPKPADLVKTFTLRDRPEFSLGYNSYCPEPQKKSRDFPSGLVRCRRLVVECLRDACYTYQLPMGQVAVAGFSQGGMLAADLIFQLEPPPLAVGLFSAAPMAQADWRARMLYRDATRVKSVPILQYHGQDDWVVPYKAGLWLSRFLRRMDLTTSFVSIPLLLRIHWRLWMDSAPTKDCRASEPAPMRRTRV
ncbi:MAG: uncharacterized protein KVP18_000985 [Porospora cf. gigantea A]|uniref:uncharacterized protein n=1 Tax=Porospora cf. gigantea A TaxID=2853593 RepID=UPI00355A3DA9|nr:MAG: hypothetical protein KVP18_000985 [Porospora cf. gigantea A]